MVTSLPHTSRASSLWRTVSAAALTSALTGFSGAGCCGDYFSSPQPAARTRAAEGGLTGRGRGMARVMPSMRRKQASGGRGAYAGLAQSVSRCRPPRVAQTRGEGCRAEAVARDDDRKSRERQLSFAHGSLVSSVWSTTERAAEGGDDAAGRVWSCARSSGIGVASVEGCAADYYGRGFAVFALDDGRCGGGGRRGRDVGCGVGARGGEPGLQCGVDGGGGLRADGSAAGAACRSWRRGGRRGRGLRSRPPAGCWGRWRGTSSRSSARRRHRISPTPALGVRDARDGRAAASTRAGVARYARCATPRRCRCSPRRSH